MTTQDGVTTTGGHAQSKECPELKKAVAAQRLANVQERLDVLAVPDTDLMDEITRPALTAEEVTADTLLHLKKHAITMAIRGYSESARTAAEVWQSLQPYTAIGLRDQVAMAVLPYLISKMDGFKKAWQERDRTRVDIERLASELHEAFRTDAVNESYLYADAMLQARKGESDAESPDEPEEGEKEEAEAQA